MIPDDQKQNFIDDLFTHAAFILLYKDSDFDVGGNAVVITLGIAITAAHILRNNKFDAFFDAPLGSEKFYPDEGLSVVVNSKKYNTHYIFSVERAVMLHKTDLAVLYLKSAHRQPIPQDLWNDVVIRLTPPKEDSHVFTIGSVFEEDSYEVRGNTLDVRPRYVASFGEVNQIMLQHPHPQSGLGFYATLATPNTLSGSPVFNKDRELIGLISRGSSDLKDPAAFVAALYPLFMNIKSFSVQHLYELAQQGTIACEGLDDIEVIDDDHVNLLLPKSLNTE